MLADARALVIALALALVIALALVVVIGAGGGGGGGAPLHAAKKRIEVTRYRTRADYESAAR